MTKQEIQEIQPTCTFCSKPSTCIMEANDQDWILCDKCDPEDHVEEEYGMDWNDNDYYRGFD